MVNELSLGQALQKARRTAGLTQQELCNKAGLSYSTLAKIERGAIKAPSVFTIHNVATTLGVTLNDLMAEITPGSASPSTPKRQSRSGVRFVYFDINGCLVRFFHAAFTELARDIGAPADSVETVFWHYNDLVCRGEMSLEAFNGTLAEALHVKRLDWQRYYMEAVRPIPEMHELAAWTSEHYHIGLLSNIMPGFIEYMKTHGLIPNLPYSAVIDSSKVKAIKPEPRMYEIATQKAGVKPSEILLVDDSRANIIAAERSGWHVLWFDDFKPAESVKKVQTALEPAG